MRTYWISQVSLHLCALSYLWCVLIFFSLRKQPTFGGATTGFPAKWRLRNWRRNSILMTRHYPDQGSASDWSCRVGNLIQPIRSATQVWVVKRHQYGISALVSQTSFGGETSGSVTKMSAVFSGYIFLSVFISPTLSCFWRVLILLKRFHIFHTLSHIPHLSHILTSLLHSHNSLALL